MFDVSCDVGCEYRSAAMSECDVLLFSCARGDPSALAYENGRVGSDGGGCLYVVLKSAPATRAYCSY